VKLLHPWLGLILASLLVVLSAGCPSAPPPSSEGVVVPPLPKIEGTAYTVQSGDTLYSIARRHGVDWREILDANPTVNLLHPRAGQVIMVPEVKPGVPSVAPTTPPPAKNPGHPGPLPAEDSFVWPIRGQILSRFRQPVSWRMDEPNQGLDIRAAPGQVVVAAKSGLVNTFTRVYGFGKVVTLQHQDGTLTFYGHLADILVTHGTWVKQGEVIATAGSSGLSSGTELHFRIWRGEQFVDPLPVLTR